jgi:hypothetical protein
VCVYYYYSCLYSSGHSPLLPFLLYGHPHPNLPDTYTARSFRIWCQQVRNRKAVLTYLYPTPPSSTRCWSSPFVLVNNNTSPLIRVGLNIIALCHSHQLCDSRILASHTLQHSTSPRPAVTILHCALTSESVLPLQLTYINAKQLSCIAK